MKGLLIVILFLSLILDNSVCQNSLDCSVFSSETFTKDDLQFKICDEPNFYAFGSWHGHNSAYKSFVSCFKQLYFNANVRVIFIEYSYSEGLLIDNYIKTGEKDEYLNTFVYKSDYEYLFNPLKLFYSSLPDSEKFTIVGVDRSFHRGFPDVVFALKMLIPENKEPNEQIKSVITEIVSYNDILSDFSGYESSKILNNFFLCYVENKNSFKDYFCENFAVLEKVLAQYNLSKSIPDVNYENCDSLSYCKREQFIYKNLKDEIFQRKGIDFIGMFGLAHVFLDKKKRFDTFQMKQEGNYEYYSFIARLNKECDSPVKGSVCAVQIHESNILFRKSLKTIVGKSVFRQMMRQTKSNNTYLFDFSEDSANAEIAKKKFQYLILVR